MTDQRSRVRYLCLQATHQGQASHAHVHEIIAGLKKHNIDVKLYEPDYGNEAEHVSALTRLREFVRVQARLLVDAEKGDVLYIRWHFATILTALFARSRELRVVQEVNGPYDDVFAAWPLMAKIRRAVTWMMRTQLVLADKVIVVTDQLKVWVAQETHRIDTHVIPNGANTNIFRPEATAKLDAPDRYAIFFGALASWQGVDVLLEAVKDAAWPKGVRLVVAGDGMERGKIEAAHRAGLLLYLGKVPYTEIAGLVAGSVCSLIPKNNVGGRTETGLMPLKLFESMACGVPVVVTDMPGMADVVRSSGGGLTIPEGDAHALASAVAHLATEDDERAGMGAAGRKAVVESHSWAARAGQTALVIDELSDRNYKWKF